MHATYHLAWTTAQDEGKEVFFLIPTCNNKPLAWRREVTWIIREEKFSKFSFFFLSEHQQRNESGRVSKLGKNRKLTSGPKEENKSSSSESSLHSATQRYHYYVRLIIPKHLSSADDHPFFFVSFGNSNFSRFYLNELLSLAPPPPPPLKARWQTRGKGRPIKSRRSKINISNLSSVACLPAAFPFYFPWHRTKS